MSESDNRGPNWAKNQAKKERRRARKLAGSTTPGAVSSPSSPPAAEVVQTPKSTTLIRTVEEQLGNVDAGAFAKGRDLLEITPQKGSSRTVISAPSGSALVGYVKEKKATANASKTMEERLADLEHDMQQQKDLNTDHERDMRDMKQQNDSQNAIIADIHQTDTALRIVRWTMPTLVQAAVRIVCKHVFGTSDEDSNAAVCDVFSQLSLSPDAADFRAHIETRPQAARVVLRQWAIDQLLVDADQRNVTAHPEDDLPGLVRQLFAFDAVQAPDGGDIGTRPALLAARFLLELLDFLRPDPEAQEVLQRGLGRSSGFVPWPEQYEWLETEYKVILQ